MQGRGTGRSPRRLRRRCGLRPQKPPCRAVWAAPACPPQAPAPTKSALPSHPAKAASPQAPALSRPAGRSGSAGTGDGLRPAPTPACGRRPCGPAPCTIFPRNCPLHQLSPTQKAAPLPGGAGQRGGLPWPHPYFLGKVLFTHGTSTQESTAVITISGSM